MAARVLVVVGLGLASWPGCLKPDLTYCADGRACPASLVCDEVHHSCVTPGQLAACAGKPDASACMTEDFTGLCFDQVCVVPGCGNSVIEPGEVCDDGNRISGDGCSVNCASTESCGNGVVDMARGETCDDGNLASHDGCNSRCGGESATWQAHPVHLTSFDRRGAAYDSTRDRLVLLSNAVWEWDGAHWSVSGAAVPQLSWQAAAYDPVHSLTIGIATAPSSAALLVYTWNGDKLVEMPTTNTPSGPILGMVWDGARKKLLAIANQEDFYLDAGTATWTKLVDSLSGINSAQLAFDSKNGIVVMYDANAAKTNEWNGAAWTTNSAVPRGGFDAALVYDEARAHVLSIGGQSDPLAVDVYATAAWTNAGFTTDSRKNAIAWYDKTLARVRVMGGGPEEMLEIEDTTTSVVGEPHPASQQFNGLAYDPKRARLAVFDTSGVGYVWNTAWTPLPPAGLNVVNPTYDPIREGTLAVVGNQQPEQLMLLRDSWQAVTTLPSGVNAMDLAYDFANRRMIATSGASLFALSSTGTSWTNLPAPVWMPSPTSAAFDVARSLVSVMTMGVDSQVYDLEGDQWNQSLSPGTGYRIFSELQARSLLLVPVVVTPTQHQLWERTNGVFKPLGLLPITGQISDVSELPYGRTMMLVSGGAGAVMLERQMTSSLPDESCVAGEDADGDGAAGCADPDCWWSCWPACPVATSCP
ncbi:MAG TPA: DUF4215 domain-containing protein [Kofleriaceae bacterium]|nr:DUF4215 domain-containing protein [Kofleriaceae bacterium]